MRRDCDRVQEQMESWETTPPDWARTHIAGCSRCREAWHWGTALSARPAPCPPHPRACLLALMGAGSGAVSGACGAPTHPPLAIRFRHHFRSELRRHRTHRSVAGEQGRDHHIANANRPALTQRSANFHASIREQSHRQSRRHFPESRSPRGFQQHSEQNAAGGAEASRNGSVYAVGEGKAHHRE
jgi:hypothetical protein